MSDKQKVNAIDYLVPPMRESRSDTVEMNSESLPLNISQDNPLHQLPIPQYIADKLWQESRELASSGSDICAFFQVVRMEVHG